MIIGICSIRCGCAKQVDLQVCDLVLAIGSDRFGVLGALAASAEHELDLTGAAGRGRPFGAVFIRTTAYKPCQGQKQHYIRLFHNYFFLSEYYMF